MMDNSTIDSAFFSWVKRFITTYEFYNTEKSEAILLEENDL